MTPVRPALGRLALALLLPLPLRAAVATDVGPRSPPVDLSAYGRVLHIDGRHGDDVAGDGSAGRPWASLPHALEQAGNPAPGARVALLVAAGRYAQPTLLLKPRVDLFGGFAAGSGFRGPRDVQVHASELDGAEARRIAHAADDQRLDGFHLIRGRVRGKGAALHCDGVSPVVANCTFAGNRTLIPQPWAPAQLHETAHDGGAVFVTNGAAPRFEHCHFRDNATECGRGGALAADRGAAPHLVACVFTHNRSGLDDPLRSSDGGAVSFFDWSGGEIRGCIFSANTALSRNDGGGVFLALWSAPRISDCLFTANDGGDDAGALFIGGQEHRYGQPLDPYPPAERFHVQVERSVFVGNTNSTRNSGAMRITMEARVTFRDNVIAENQGGFYLQRSEIIAERNTVWQDWRFVEDKPTLGPSRLAGNILRGPLGGPLEARVALERNMAERAAGGAGTIAVADVFVDDGVAGKIVGLRFEPVSHTTILTVDRELASGTATGRVVGVGAGRVSQWRVVQAARGRELALWGRLEPETRTVSEFTLLRTFKLRPDAPAGLGARVP